MITTVKGDLIAAFINGDVDVFVHGCNCFNTMGAGIAAQVKLQLPELYQADQQTIKGDRLKLGRITYAACLPAENRYGINAYTQYTHWDANDMVHYPAVQSCMAAIRDTFGGQGLKIGFPMIGAGLGGADWDKIHDIILHGLANEHVVVYEFDPAAAAQAKAQATSVTDAVRDVFGDSAGGHHDDYMTGAAPSIGDPAPTKTPPSIDVSDILNDIDDTGTDKD